jgi:uncharacterized protein YdhG (YjbR/CyaY superfamily)
MRTIHTTPPGDPADGLPADLPAPARRALQAAGYSSLRQLEHLTAADLRKLHGVGPRALEAIRSAMWDANLRLRDSAVSNSAAASAPDVESHPAGSRDRGVEEYYRQLEPDSRRGLKELRRVILAELPSVEERISYRIPTFFVAGRRVVHIAAWKEHLSMYPAPAALPGLEKELDRHRSGRGTLKFPLNRPLPVELIRAAVAWQMGRVSRNGNGAEAR